MTGKVKFEVGDLVTEVLRQHSWLAMVVGVRSYRLDVDDVKVLFLSWPLAAKREGTVGYVISTYLDKVLNA